MAKESLSLTISSDVVNLEAVSEFVTKAAQKAKMDEQGVFAIQMAVDEACTNIIEHAYRHAPGDIHLSVLVEPGEFVIAIRDHGIPFDPDSVPPPNLESDLQDRQVGGLGLYFMRKLMDSVRFSSDPEEGNQVVMIKRGSRNEAKNTGHPFGLLVLEGRVDAASAPALEAQLEEMMARNNIRIVIDMAKVSYISSSGLKVLLAALRQMRRRQGNLVLCALRPKVTSIFEMAGFDLVFPIAPDVQAASQLLEQA